MCYNIFQKITIINALVLPAIMPIRGKQQELAGRIAITSACWYTQLSLTSATVCAVMSAFCNIL